MRNSSLVECACADNNTGLKTCAEAADDLMREATLEIVVGERSGVAEKGDWEAAWSEPKRECRNE